MLLLMMINGKVITVNNNGNSSFSCCKYGKCACSSFFNALSFAENDTVINIASQSVLLNTLAQIGMESLTGRKSKNLNNITITGNKGVTVTCNDTGIVLCDMCSNVTIQEITWDQCGDINYPKTAGVVFNRTSNVSIINCTFQNFMPCITVEISHSTGDIKVTNSKFMFNTISNASLCRSSFYSSLLIYQTNATAISISNSLFYYNGNANQKGVTLNGSLLYYNVNENLASLSILVKNTDFAFNGIRGLYVYDSAAQTKVTLDAVNVLNNNQGVYVRPGGRDFALIYIYSSTFSFNNNGALTLYLFVNYGLNIKIYNTTFTENKGSDSTLGAAVYAVFSCRNSTINITLCNFFNNTGGNSIAHFSKADFPFYFINIFLASSNFTSNKDGPALYLTYCFLNLHSSILFQDNSAKSGAAIYIAESSQISVDNGSTVQFINNTASLRGGAMYIDLTNCYDHGIVFTNLTRYESVSFINNSAKLSGNSMYFNIPDSCDVISDYTKNNSAAYVPYKFNYTHSHKTNGPAIATTPYTINLCFPGKCGSNKTTKCAIKNSKMLGQSIYFNATVCDYFGIVAETTQFEVNFINYQFKYRLLENKVLVQNGSNDRINILSVGADRDLENDINIKFSISSLLSPEYKRLIATLSLTLSSCYNGFLFQEQSQQCRCYNKDGYLYCEGDSANIKLGYWFGVISGKYTTSICHSQYCNFFTHRRETSSGFYNLPEQIDDQCSIHRTGVACGKCSEGYTLAYNSPNCISLRKCSLGITVLVVVLTALYWIATVTILFGVAYYFKTKAKLSLGYFYGIMYFYSTVDILLTSNLYTTDKVFYTVTTLSSFAKLNPHFLGRLCFSKNLDGIDQQFIHYCHIVFTSIILIGIVIAVKRCKRIADYVDHCVVQVFCLFLLLSYPSLTSISLLLLRSLKYDGINGLYTYLSPHMKYFSSQHTAYASVAISCGFLVTIGFPFLLLIEPFMLRMLKKLLKKKTVKCIKRFIEKHIWLTKIESLLDKLQDCYKDQHRWFAAYYLICRLVIMLITYYANDDYNYMIYYLQTACVVITMTHIWIQPYKDDVLNVMDTVILLIMLLIVNLSASSFSASTAATITITLISTPLFLWVGMIAIRLLRHRLGVKVKKLSSTLAKKLQQSYQGIRNACCNFKVDEEETLSQEPLVEGDEQSS